MHYFWTHAMPIGALCAIGAYLVTLTSTLISRFDAAHKTGSVPLWEGSILDRERGDRLIVYPYGNLAIEHIEVSEDIGLKGLLDSETTVAQTASEWLHAWDREQAEDNRRVREGRLLLGEDITPAEHHLYALDDQLSTFQTIWQYLKIQETIDRWIAEDTTTGYTTRLIEVREAIAETPTDYPTGELPMIHVPTYQRAHALALLGS